MDRMAILIGNDPANGSEIVPMLEREGLRVELTVSPEHALERLQEIVDQQPGGDVVPPMGVRRGNGGGWPDVAGENGDDARWEGAAPGAGVGTTASAGGGPLPGASSGLALDRRLSAVQERARQLEGEEQKIINEALQHAGGNKTAAARLLGISRYALQRRLRRFAKPQTQAGGPSEPDES